MALFKALLQEFFFVGLLFRALFWALRIGTYLDWHIFLVSPLLWHFFGHLNEHFFGKGAFWAPSPFRGLLLWSIAVLIET